MPRICITSTGDNLNAPVDPRFGRCAYFIIVDTQSMDFEALSNQAVSASSGAGITAAQTVTSKNVSAVITGSVGPNAFQALNAAGTAVYGGASGTVKDTIERFREGNMSTIQQPGPAHRGMGRGRGMGGGRGRGGRGR